MKHIRFFNKSFLSIINTLELVCSLWQKLRSCNLPHPNRGLKPRSLFRMTTQLAYILWPSVESAIHIVFRGLNHSNLHTKTANVRAVVVVDGGGGGGWWWWWLFPRMRGFWGTVTIRFPPALFFFFFKWRLVRAHEFQSLYQDQSTVARRAEMTAAEYSLTTYVWARFMIGSRTMAGKRCGQPSQTSLG